MNTALKQRLIGAAVLVALGVIFVPMLLERGSEDSRLSVRMEIPPKPEFSMPDALDDPPKIEPIKPLQPIEQAIAQAKPKKPDSDNKSKPAASKPKTSITKTPPTSSSPEKPASSKPKTGSTKDDQWIVQVGSFSRQDNAQVLRDKLKSSGFAEVYMETANSSSGPVYRVRIGLVDGRANAEKLVSKLSKQGGYRAIVLAND